MRYGRCVRADTYTAGHSATPQSPVMALAAILMAFTLTVHPQICLGQLNLGNSFGAESNKIAASQQQPQKSNSETMTNAENNSNTGNVKFLIGADFHLPSVNKTTTFLKGNTISNIKFVRNQAYEAPAPAPSPAIPVVNGNGLAPQSPQGNFRSVFINANPIIDHLNATAQTPIKNPEMQGQSAGSLSKSPLYITFGSPPLAASPSRTTFLTNGQPIISSIQFVPNPVKLQTTASPAQKHVPHQTFTSFQMPPTNVQNQAKLLYAQTPPATPPTQPDNTVQSRHSLTSLLLSHLLSQGSNLEDPSTPIIMNHYPNRNLKPSNIKALLPLLLSLLNERSNDCCECGKYQRYYKCKPQKMHKRFEENSLEMNSKSNTQQRSLHAWQVDKHRRRQDTVEEEDYSDEISDYSDEYYDE